MDDAIPELKKQDRQEPEGEEGEEVVEVMEDDEDEEEDSKARSDKRPTWIRVNIRYLVPETLDYYRLPWEYAKDKDYILIKKYVSRDLQEELFRHTKRIRRERLAPSEQDPNRKPHLDSDSGSDSDRYSNRRRHRHRRSRSGSRSRSSSRPQLRSRSRSRLSSETESNSDSSSESDTEYRENLRPGLEPDESYSPPKDSNGASLRLQIDVVDKATFIRPDLSTQRTVDLAKHNGHLQDRLHLQSLTKASVMTAHQSIADGDILGAALDYLDVPKYSPDSHFRWIHAQMPRFNLDQYQYFISQLSELKKEEQALVLALLKESTTTGSSKALPSFKVKRADARNTRVRGEPGTWAMLISMQYLTKKSSSREEDGHCISFARYQHPLEPIHTFDHQDRIHSIRQMSPVYKVNCVRFSAFLTSSGTLITLSSESFSSLCQAPLSTTKLEKPPQKVRMYDPDGTEFHFPLKLCGTYFALARAVVTACRKKYSNKSEDYAVFDEHGVQIEATDWEQYCSTQVGPWIDVWIRLLSTEPEMTTYTILSEKRNSRSGFNRERSRTSYKRSRFTSRPIAARNTLPNSDLRNKSFKVSAIHAKSGPYTGSRALKSGKKLSTQTSRMQGHGAEDMGLPPNRVSRFVVEPDDDIVTNKAVHRHDPDDLLFRTSKTSTQSTQITPSTAAKNTRTKSNSGDSRQSMERKPSKSTSAQVLPFFQWPTGDTESVIENQIEAQSLDDMNNILDEVSGFLLQGYLDKEDDRDSRKQLSELYKALDPPNDFKRLKDIINTGLKSHQPIETDEDTSSKESWQGLLYEVIRRWDYIINCFCTAEHDHVVLRSFRHARAAFFQNVSDVYESQYAHVATAAKEEAGSADPKDAACFIFDCMEVLDERLTVPTSPEVDIEGCRDCQRSDSRWPKYVNRKTAIAHLREQHFRASKISDIEIERYIVSARHLGNTFICMLARQSMLAVLDHLGEAKNLIDEIRSGVTGSMESGHPYRLPRSLVNSFRLFIGGVVHAAAASDAVKTTTEFRSDNTTWGMRKLSRKLDRVFTTGVSLEFALCKVKHDLILQSHINDYSTTVSYETVDSPCILINILASLIGRSHNVDALNLTNTYKDFTDLLRYSMRRSPGKRLHSDIIRVSEEADTIRTLMLQQIELLTSLLQVLKPESFTVTTTQRQRQYKLEQAAATSIMKRLGEETKTLAVVKSELERIERENIRALAILQDDHGKAILVFTIVTVIFLPLSFATSFLGMNTVDIRNMGSSQWLFWALSLPLTFFTMAVVVTVGYYGEQIRDFIAGMLGRLSPAWTQAPLPTPYTADPKSADTRLKQNNMRDEV